MTRDKIQSYLEFAGVEAGLLEPEFFDEAIIGICESVEIGPVVAYDRQRCIELIALNLKLNHDTAEEHFEFNVECACPGPGAPLFIDTRYAE